MGHDIEIHHFSTPLDWLINRSFHEMSTKKYEISTTAAYTVVSFLYSLHILTSINKRRCFVRGSFVFLKTVNRKRKEKNPLPEPWSFGCKSWGLQQFDLLTLPKFDKMMERKLQNFWEGI